MNENEDTFSRVTVENMNWSAIVEVLRQCLPKLQIYMSAEPATGYWEIYPADICTFIYCGMCVCVYERW